MEENPTVTTALMTKLALTIAALIFITTHSPRHRLVVA
jgi:hypothetical protein